MDRIITRTFILIAAALVGLKLGQINQNLTPVFYTGIGWAACLLYRDYLIIREKVE